jgi:hypothetical protein
MWFLTGWFSEPGPRLGSVMIHKGTVVMEAVVVVVVVVMVVVVEVVVVVMVTIHVC